MVSGWMENGNIMNYLEVIPDQNPFSLVSTLYFTLVEVTESRRSWRMQPMAYNTCINTTLFTVISKE